MDMVNDRHPKMTGCKQICISEGLSLSVQRSERNFDIMFDININININKHNCNARFDISFLTLSTHSTKHNWNAWSLFPLCTVPKLHLALKLFLQHHLFIMCFAPQIWTLSSNFPQIWTLLSNFPQISTLSWTSRKFVAKFLSNMNTIIEIYCKIAFKDVHDYCWI